MRPMVPRCVATSMTLAAAPAYAMDEGAGVAGLSLVVSIAVGVAGGAISGWRRWKFWLGVGAAWGACALLVMLAHFLLRGSFDFGRYVELFFIGAFVSVIPLVACFAAAYLLGSLFARGAGAPAGNGNREAAKPPDSV